jgi:hypothetical protein
METKNFYFKCTIIVVLLIVPILVMIRCYFFPVKSLVNDAGWTVTPIPVPEEVTGHYLLRACLSDDNSTLVVVGRPVISSQQFSETIIDPIEFGAEEFTQITSQKIYFCSWPPKNHDDYCFVAEIPGFSQVVACAISPDGMTLAILSREFSWNNTERYAKNPILNNKNSFKDGLFCNDVLYTVSLNGGKLQPLVVIQSGTKLETALISPYAICWNEAGNMIFCYDAGENYGFDGSIWAVNLSGEISLVKQLPKSLVISNLKYIDGELCFFTYQIGAPMSGSVSIYTRMKQDGTIIETRPLKVKNFIPFSGSNLSPLLIGNNNIIVHGMPAGLSFQKVGMDSLHAEESHWIRDVDNDEIPYSFFLSQFLKNSKDFLVVKYLDTTATGADNKSYKGHAYAKNIYRIAKENKKPITQLLLVVPK